MVGRLLPEAQANPDRQKRDTPREPRGAGDAPAANESSQVGDDVSASPVGGIVTTVHVVILHHAADFRGHFRGWALPHHHRHLRAAGEVFGGALFLGAHADGLDLMSGDAGHF